MVTANGFLLITTTTYWNIWSDPTFYTTNQAWFTAAALAYPDKAVVQVRADMGYDIFPIASGQSYDGVHMDLVLDPASQGGARTGSVFGSYGISLSPDSIFNTFNGVSQFWWYILTTHELVNVWTGVLSQGWPWADGSPIWLSGSQFPNFTDIVVTAELGLMAVSQAQAARELTAPGVSFLYDVQHTLGWFPYQVMFQWVRYLQVQWYTIAEPIRSGLLALLLGISGVGNSVLSGLAKSGISISFTSVLQAQELFPSIPVLFAAVEQNIGTVVLFALASGGIAASIYLYGRRGKTKAGARSRSLSRLG